MRKFACVWLMLITGLAACSSTSQQTPDEVATQLLNALQTQDNVAMQQTFCHQQLAALYPLMATETPMLFRDVRLIQQETGNKASVDMRATLVNEARPTERANIHWELAMEQQSARWCITNLTAIRP